MQCPTVHLFIRAPNSSCSIVLLFHHVLSLSPLTNFFLFPAFSVGFGEKMLEGRVVIKLGLRDYALQQNLACRASKKLKKCVAPEKR